MRSSEIVLSLNRGAEFNTPDGDLMVDPTPNLISPTGGDEFVLRAGTLFNESCDKLHFRRVGGGHLSILKKHVYVVYMWKTGDVLWASEEHERRHNKKHLMPDI
ncbi:hypothetical protein ACFL29_01525 [Patescibacteria group bacterium]